MANRTRPTLEKRAKERARQEKRKQKDERRASAKVQRSSSPEDGRGILATLTDKGHDLLVRAAPTHVAGVRAHLVDLASNEDFAALGRVFDAVADSLISAHPEMEIRG